MAVIPGPVGVWRRRRISDLPGRWDASTGANVLWTVTPARPRPLQPHRLGRSRLRDERGQQPRRRHLQAGPLRRGRRPPRTARVQRWIVMRIDRRTGKTDWELHGVRGRAAREAPHQGDLRQRHARNRRPLCRRVLRLAGPLRFRHATASCAWKKDLGVLESAPTTCPSTSGARRARRSSTRTW